MVYIIQPFGYKSSLTKIIKKFLNEKYPDKKFKIKRYYNTKNRTTLANTYFIINDPNLRSWNGLQISQKIRKNEPKAILILASTEIDYIKFFRSHVGFLGVIDINNINTSEIENYLEDSIKLSQKDN